MEEAAGVTPYIAYLWMAAGAVLMFLEVMVLPGIGLLFTGLAAICVGIVIQLGMAASENVFVQAAWFFALTAAWAAILWKPMQRFRSGKTESYSNMVGESAEVTGGGLHKGRKGKVKWSGTIMNAELAADAGEASLEDGATVEIVKMEGITLIVRPKR